MKPVAWMAAASLSSWLVVAGLAGGQTSLAVLFGMAGPLVVAGGSWVLVERAYRRSPARLTFVMASAFGGKLVFFGVYVSVVLSVLSVSVVPFVVSFTAYFLVLHLVEALWIRRLFAGGSHTSS